MIAAAPLVGNNEPETGGRLLAPLPSAPRQPKAPPPEDDADVDRAYRQPTAPGARSRACGSVRELLLRVIGNHCSAAAKNGAESDEAKPGQQRGEQREPGEGQRRPGSRGHARFCDRRSDGLRDGSVRFGESSRYALPASPMRVSFLIPAYNEAAKIAEVLKRVDELDLELEKQVVVIDDGSTDETATIVSHWASHHDYVLLISQENHGKGAAIRAGIAHVNGEIVVIQDADMDSTRLTCRN